MTYVLAWKSDRSVFFVSDTAGSGPVKPPGMPRSSVGETQTSERRDTGDFVEESLLKIGHLRRGVVFGYSGRVSHATDLLVEFERRLRTRSPIVECFTGALDGFGPTSPVRDVEVAFGFWDGERPRLFSYSALGSQRLSEHDELVQLGSIHRTQYPGLSDLLISSLRDSGIPDERFLELALAVCQSYGVFDVLMEHGVGGYFCGIEVDESGPRWQKDTIVVSYVPSSDGGIESPVWTKAGVREDVLLLHSSVATKKVIANRVMTEDFKDWQSRWKERAVEYLNSGTAEVCVFLHRSARTIVLVKSDGSAKNDLFEVRESGDTLEWQFSPKLMDKLRSELQAQDSNEIPMLIHYLVLENDDREQERPRDSEFRSVTTGSGEPVIDRLPLVGLYRNPPGKYIQFRGSQFLESTDFELDMSRGFGWHASIRFAGHEVGRRGLAYDIGSTSQMGPRFSVGLGSEGELAVGTILNPDCVHQLTIDGFVESEQFEKWIYLCGEVARTSDRVRLSLWINGALIARTGSEPLGPEPIVVGEATIGSSLERQDFGVFDVHTLALVARPLSMSERREMIHFLESGMTLPSSEGSQNDPAL